MQESDRDKELKKKKKEGKCIKREKQRMKMDERVQKKVKKKKKGRKIHYNQIVKMDKGMWKRRNKLKTLWRMKILGREEITIEMWKKKKNVLMIVEKKNDDKRIKNIRNEKKKSSKIMIKILNWPMKIQ